jgi:hypothetical protein
MPQLTSDTQPSSTGMGAGHESIFCNKRADELAKKCADTLFTGHEPLLSLPYSVVKREIGDWMERKHIEYWKSGKDSKHSNALK